MEDLLEEYRETLKATKAAMKQAPKEEQRVWTGMVASLNYVKVWLETGWPPGSGSSDQVFFSDPDTFEKVGSVNYLNPYSPNAFEEVEKRIDAERSNASRG